MYYIILITLVWCIGLMWDYFWLLHCRCIELWRLLIEQQLLQVSEYMHVYFVVKECEKMAFYYCYRICFQWVFFFICLGQSDVYENGSSGDTSEDVMFDIQNPRKSELSIQQGRANVHQEKDYHGLWSNSSRLDCFTLYMICLYLAYNHCFSSYKSLICWILIPSCSINSVGCRENQGKGREFGILIPP